MQLDLFEHSRDVMLRNAAVEALRRRDAAALDGTMARLAAEYPNDAWLAPLAALRSQLDSRPSPHGLSAREAMAALHDMTQRIEPAARRLLGGDASAWLAPCWRELAQAMNGFAFDADAPSLHAAPLLLRAEEWAAATAAVEAIASWRRKPVPLEWMIEARYPMAGIDAVWAMLAELAWMAPQRARQCALRLDDGALAALVTRFEAEFDGGDLPDGFAMFPAWLLYAAAPLAEHLMRAEAGSATHPERCARQVMRLRLLERQGRHHELIEGRRTLRDLDAVLFAAYMRSR